MRLGVIKIQCLFKRSGVAQRRKASVRTSLLDAARVEFEVAGYTGASLRAIAERAGRSLGNVRNYFPDKASLFSAVVEPTRSAVDAALEAALSVPLARPDQRVEHDWAWIERVLAFIFAHEQGLRLLVVGSAGSPFARWRDTVLEDYVRLEQSRLLLTLEAFPARFHHRPSPDLVRCICEMYFSVIERWLRGAMRREQVLQTLIELEGFRHAGSTYFLAPRKTR